MAELRLCILLVWGLPLLSLAQADFRVTADRDSLGLGEPLTWTLQSDEPLTEGQRWTWPTLSPGDSLPQGWEILSVGPLDSAASQELDAGLRRTQTIEVLAWDTGFKVIEPLALIGADGDTVKSTPQLIQIGLTPLESNPAPRPMQGFTPFRWTWWERLSQAWPVLLAGLLAVAAFFALRRWASRDRADAETVVEHVPAEPGHVIALRMLRDLNAEQPWTSGQEKETQARLSDALRLHLDSAFGVKSIERTTTELVAQLRHATIRGLSASDITWLSEVLQRSDLVKFARQSMPHDAHHRTVADALHWVERTQPILDPDDPGSEPNTPDADV